MSKHTEQSAEINVTAFADSERATLRDFRIGHNLNTTYKTYNTDRKTRYATVCSLVVLISLMTYFVIDNLSDVKKEDVTSDDHLDDFLKQLNISRSDWDDQLRERFKNRNVHNYVHLIHDPPPRRKFWIFI